MLSSESVTQLLHRWSEGDEQALERLTPLVYDELRRLASGYLRQQRPGHTLQATALVHEAYLQLLEMPHIEWKGRAHFIVVAAQMMRRILVDYARQQAAAKRGGGAFKVPLSRAERIPVEREVNLVALDEALAEFAKRFPRQTLVVELHFFGGLQVEEIPAVLGAAGTEVSQRTVERDLKFARAWLYQEVSRG